MFLPVGAFTAFEPEALAFFARMTSTDSDLRNDLNTLIKGLKNDDLWDELDFLNVVQLLEADSLLNLKGNYFNTTNIGSPDCAFVADQGFTTALADVAYLEVDYIPDTDGVALDIVSNESGSAFAYKRSTGNTYTPFKILFGNGVSSYSLGVDQNSSDNGTAWANGFSPGLAPNIKDNKFICVTRQDATTIALFVDGTSYSNTVSKDSGWGGSKYTVGTNADSPSTPVDEEWNVWGIGAGFTHAQMTNLYTHILAYLTARGAT